MHRSQGKCVFRAKKCQKLTVFCEFNFFGATLCGNPAVECQKLRVFCEFFWPGAPLSGKTRVKCQKLRVFCVFGVSGFVLRIVLTTRFATYGRFFETSKMSENRQETSKTEGFWRFFSCSLRESGCRVSKTEGFCDFGVPEFVLTTCFATYGLSKPCPEVPRDGFRGV